MVRFKVVFVVTLCRHNLLYFFYVTSAAAAGVPHRDYYKNM